MKNNSLELKIKKKLSTWKFNFLAYINRLLFPIYLFPFKLFTYSLYYIIKFLIKLIIWPFKSWSNFFKFLFWGTIFTYFAFTEYRFLSLVERYGGYEKFFCSEWLTTKKLQKSVVRVVGGYSEGSGFFVAGNEVLPSFHVIADEPSPKVIFPDGSFTTPIAITANPGNDLALLHLSQVHPDKQYSFASPQNLTTNEPLISAGFPLGTDLSGEVTTTKGNFSAIRNSPDLFADYVQTDINVVQGMSGGPLVDQCGDVVGINTLSLSGMSLFVSSDSIKLLWPNFSDQEITKIEVDPSLSPEDAVYAFYTYLKARQMQEGFNLLSLKYLEKTNFEEWTSRFTDILDVQIYLSETVAGSPNTVFVKFSTKNWNNNQALYHYYEGTWQTVEEDGVYKMLRSNIKEVDEPDFEWFYNLEE